MHDKAVELAEMNEGEDESNEEWVKNEDRSMADDDLNQETTSGYYIQLSRLRQALKLWTSSHIIPNVASCGRSIID